MLMREMSYIIIFVHYRGLWMVFLRQLLVFLGSFQELQLVVLVHQANTQLLELQVPHIFPGW